MPILQHQSTYFTYIFKQTTVLQIFFSEDQVCVMRSDRDCILHVAMSGQLTCLNTLHTLLYDFALLYYQFYQSLRTNVLTRRTLISDIGFNAFLLFRSDSQPNNRISMDLIAVVRYITIPTFRALAQNGGMASGPYSNQKPCGDTPQNLCRTFGNSCITLFCVGCILHHTSNTL